MSRSIITDRVMVPLVLVVLVGGFAMNIKAVESKNADLSKKLDAVRAELTALKNAQAKLVVRAAAPQPNGAAPTPGIKSSPEQTTPADAAKDKRPAPAKSDDDKPADVPL